MSQLRNDAVDNLLGALVIAGHYIIPGKFATYWAYDRAHTIMSRVLPVLQPHTSPRQPLLENVVVRP